MNLVLRITAVLGVALPLAAVRPAAGQDPAAPSATPAAEAAERPMAAERGEGEAKAGSETPAPTASTPPTATPNPTATPALSTTATPALSPTATPTPSPASDTSDHVVSRRVDDPAPSRAATAVTGVRARPDGIELYANGALGKLEVLELRNPPRLVIDLYGVRKAPRLPTPASAGFTQVRFGRDEGKVRVVLDADGELPRYQVKRTAYGLAVSTGTPSPTPTPVLTHVSTPAPTQTPTPTSNPPATSTATPTSNPNATPPPIAIRDLRFTQSNGVARIEIVGKAPHAVSQPDPQTLVLSLDGARLPRRLERSLDTSALGGPVKMVSSFNQRSTGEVKVVATFRGEVRDELVETRAGLAWTLTAGAISKREAAQPVVTAQPAEEQAAGFTAEAPSYAASGAPQKREYTGRRITLDFHDIEIRNLLRLIADVSKKNIVVADDVSGKVTVSLRNVPWDQALDLVLKTKGLGKEEMGNVIRVAKYEQIAKEQEALANAVKAKAPLIPLKVRLIPVNYAVAKDVAPQVKDVLTERGSVTIDERTNVLIVKDTQEALARAEGLVRNLDTEIPQVLIESRIIEASSNFNKAIGVQWGGNLSFGPGTGNPTGLVFPNIINTVGGAGGGPTQGTADTPNYAVNLPAAIGQGSGGGLGFVFGSASGAFNLNLRLSALENTGVLKTISAPKIATIDNREATIGQGLSIPFSQVSASGVNTTFIEAKLELKVTPHVTADGSILMKIKATNNQPNPGLTGANGQPSISKREAETAVLVKDGDTTVIGGIYTRSTSNQEARVPFFGRIPILGFFFRTRSDADDHTELLIFITPRILNRSAPAVAG